MEGRIVLLVEDNPDHQELTQRALRRAETAPLLIVAAGAEDAFDYLRCRGSWSGRDPSIRPALVLLDLKLTGMSGLEFLKRLRADRENRHLPVVVLTSSLEDQDVVASYEAGANGYVRKSIDFDEFRRQIEIVASFWLDVNCGVPWEAKAEKAGG